MSQANRRRMSTLARWATPLLVLVVCLMSVAWGGYLGQPWLMLTGVGLVCGLAVLAAASRRRLCPGAEEPEGGPPEPELDENPDPRPVPVCRPGDEPPRDPGALVEQMLAQGRYALLLRPQVARSLTEAQFRRAFEALELNMALVPEGEVTLGQLDEPSDEFYPAIEPPVERARRVVRVQALFLDRYTVTNRQYFEFVASGGYQQATFWDRSILPAMLDFVDRTGQPGPRYWKNGCYLAGQENYPVVGVCWHEAMAFARWAGKRLPTDAEWTKAGSWPVPMSETKRFQRKYPWGDTMDRHRANLWGSGPGRVVAVDAFADGVSVGGVYQLVGNVWEWTAGNYDGTCHPSGDLSFDTPLKSVRGGAYDTYFDNQASCQFQSGDSALARRRNIGFRVALGVCDVALVWPGQSAAEVDRTNPVEEPAAAS